MSEPTTHITRWSLVASLRNNQSGWQLRARNFFQPYVTYWFADRDEGLEVKAHVEHGLTLEEALSRAWARRHTEGNS